MSKHKDFLPEFEPPKKKHALEHEQLIKSLLKTQSSTDTNLERELKKGKCFVKSTDYISTNSGVGISSLEQLQNDLKQSQEHNRLLNYGLTDNDIKLYSLYKDGGMAMVHATNTYQKQDLLEQKINSILRIIVNSECKESCSKNTNLYENDNLLNSVLVPPMEDVNTLNNIINDAMFSNDNIDIKQIRCKARKTANRLQYLSSNQVSVNINRVINTNCSKQTSLWDKKNYKEDVKEKTQLQSPLVKYTCEDQIFYTIKNGEIIKVKREDKATSVELQITGQLSLENIKKLPKFSNYEEGDPSNIIYVKNLPRKISEPALQKLYKDFPAVGYRILNGKMRGQAFITFGSVETARTMLTASNGLIINNKCDKPILLQFGHTKEGNSSSK